MRLEACKQTNVRLDKLISLVFIININLHSRSTEIQLKFPFSDKQKSPWTLAPFKKFPLERHISCCTIL